MSDIALLEQSLEAHEILFEEYKQEFKEAEEIAELLERIHEGRYFKRLMKVFEEDAVLMAKRKSVPMAENGEKAVENALIGYSYFHQFLGSGQRRMQDAATRLAGCEVKIDEIKAELEVARGEIH